MLNTKDTQFKLDDNGKIFYQPAENNPLPGTAVARIVKGESSLSPGVELLQDAQTGDIDRDALKQRLEQWIVSHIREILGPLAALAVADDNDPAPVQAIAARVYENMGIIPREALEEDIAQLDADMRRTLRGKKIRLGPVLVFIPALNKPAAVHLRAVLWSLWYGRDLPPAVPQDGIVSFSVAGQEKVDEEYYRAIAYPVYGGRAIRVDMLDRLITAVYDGADKGQFQAKHEMAEWLGSSVPDLYAVLEAMGHSKAYDPADEAERPDAGNESAAPETPEESGETELSVKEAPAADTASPAEKPALATFRLKRGKAYESKDKKAPSHTRNRTDGKKGKAPYNKGGDHKNQNRKAGKGQDKKAQDKHRKKHSSAPKVISAAAPRSNPEDSPFAVLQQLKAGSKDEK